MQYFGRAFLRSNYTDITQNTYIQSSMDTEILSRKVSNFSGDYLRNRSTLGIGVLGYIGIYIYIYVGRLDWK